MRQTWILLAVSVEKIVTISIYVLEKGCFYFNLGPLIKPIRIYVLPPCHSAELFAESIQSSARSRQFGLSRSIRSIFHCLTILE